MLLNSIHGTHICTNLAALTHLPVQAGACKGALQCLGQVLSAVEPGAWPAASLSFQQLLSFTLDARPKIRKRATSSVTDVLASVQGCPANLAAASEAVLSSECRLHSWGVIDGACYKIPVHNLQSGSSVLMSRSGSSRLTSRCH